MVNFDFKRFNFTSDDNYNLSNIKERFLADNKMTGWYDLDINTREILECANEIRNKADVFIVVGIGGSYLGAKAVVDALSPYFKKDKPEIIFAGNNLSSAYLAQLIEYIKDKSVYLNVISKSGSTLETMISFKILWEYMSQNYSDLAERIIITTGSCDSDLSSIVSQNGLRHFEIPQNIGGRYSVLTAVGLLPIAVAGYDINSLLSGAKDMKKNLDDCYKYTIVRNQMLKNNKLVESFDIYEPKLYFFTEWLKQLFAESQGKNNKGILPISTVNTRDLHSLGQFFQDGTPIIFSTTIYASKSEKVVIPGFKDTMSTLNHKAMLSVVQAHYPHTPTNLIILDEINEYNLGYLIFFFEMSAMLGSYLLDINYFDQPAVNAYKEILDKLIKYEN